MPFGKIRVPLEKRQAAYQAIQAAYQAIMKAREHVAGVYADMYHEIQNNHNNKVNIAADFVKKAVEAGATAVQMDAPEVILLAQEKTLEMERLINDAIGQAIGQGGDEMKALLHEATTAALLAEEEWKKAKEMSERQMGGRRRSTHRKRTHHKRKRSNRKRTNRKRSNRKRSNHK
jgi:hypothetical protein